MEDGLGFKIPKYFKATSTGFTQKIDHFKYTGIDLLLYM